MADKTGISWTNATWNPIVGCSVVSPGCTNCYAMREAGGFLRRTEKFKGLTQDSKTGPVWTGEVRLWESALDQPLRWTKPRMIFVNSMSDLFHDAVPDEWINRIFAVMATAGKSRGHTFQVLTKRPERMRAYLRRIDDGSVGAVERYMSTDGYQEGVRARAAMPEDNRLSEPPPPTPQLRHLYNLAPMPPIWASGGGEYHWQKWPLDSVWLGVSVEDQCRADERIPLLLDTPAAVRWISAEPMLDRVDLNGWIYPVVAGGSKIDWVVVGGESGSGARPFKIEWARSVIAQCKAANVAVFCKQLGSRPVGEWEGRPFPNRYDRLCDRKGGDISEFPSDLRVREYPGQESV